MVGLYKNLFHFNSLSFQSISYGADLFTELEDRYYTKLHVIKG